MAKGGQRCSWEAAGTRRRCWRCRAGGGDTQKKLSPTPTPALEKKQGAQERGEGRGVFGGGEHPHRLDVAVQEAHRVDGVKREGGKSFLLNVANKGLNMPTLQLYFTTHPNGSQMKRLKSVQVFRVKDIPSSGSFFLMSACNKPRTFVSVPHVKT